jgi:heme oxygenase
MPQGMSPPHQSNATFHAELIGAVYLVETPMLGGLLLWQNQKIML